MPHRNMRHVNCRSHWATMLYLNCKLDPVRLNEHLRGTHESEKKNNNKQKQQAGD